MIVLNKYPKLDVHGETTDTIVFILEDFINDNLKMKNEYIVIIHGKGSGKLKNRVHELLKQNKNVEKYELDIANLGQTLIKLKK